MNDEEELDYGGHNGGWRSPYPWWRQGWDRRPMYVPVPVPVRTQALLAQDQCPVGYALDASGKCAPVDPCPNGYYLVNGKCSPLDTTSSSQLGLGVAVAGLAALTIFLLARR